MRRHPLYLTCLVVVFLMAGLAHSQNVEPVLEAKMLLATDGVYAGSTVNAAVEAEVASGYHINDHHPTLDYLIPTELKLEPTRQVTVDKVVYPKGQPVKFAFSDDALSVYEGSLLVGARLKVAPGTPPGTYALKGKLAYQACNDHACLPPASVPLALTLKVVERGVALKRVNANVFSKLNLN